MSPTLITVLTVCLGVLIAAAHAAAVFWKRLGRFAVYINIPLHIGMLALLLIGGAELSAAALFIMASLLVYLILSLVGQYAERRGEDKP